MAQGKLRANTDRRGNLHTAPITTALKFGYCDVCGLEVEHVMILTRNLYFTSFFRHKRRGKKRGQR